MILLLISVSASAQDKIDGYWLTQDGNSIVEIYKDDAGDYSGKIVWLKNPTDSKGNPHTDKMNNDRSLRNRPMMGLNILENLKYDDEWKGTIYAAKRGRKLNASLSLKSDDELTVEVSYMRFSRQQIWTKTELPK